MTGPFKRPSLLHATRSKARLFLAMQAACDRCSMNEHNRAVLHRLQATLEPYVAGTSTSIEDLQHQVSTTAQLLERGAGTVAEALRGADAECELLLFATPAQEQLQRLRDLTRGLQLEIQSALGR
jgi:hypothetical protein